MKVTDEMRKAGRVAMRVVSDEAVYRTVDVVLEAALAAAPGTLPEEQQRAIVRAYLHDLTKSTGPCLQVSWTELEQFRKRWHPTANQPQSFTQNEEVDQQERD